MCRGYDAEDRAGLKRVAAIFAPLVLYWSLYYQQNTTWVTTASEMDTSLIANTDDVLGAVDDVMVTALVPLFAVWVYPSLRSCCGGGCTPLRKMSFGIAMAATAFVAAGLLQRAVDARGDGDGDGSDGDGNPNGLSVAWILPQFLFISLAETLVSVTGLDFAYTQATTRTRGMVQGLWALSQLGSLITALLSFIDIDTLQMAYFIYAGGMWVFLGVFVVIAVRYKYVYASDEQPAG